MSRTRTWRLWLPIAVVAGVFAVACMAQSSKPVANEQLLQYAENIKTANNAKFADLLQELERNSASFSRAQQRHLRYLQAWQVAYRGDYDKAIPRLEEIAGDTADYDLKARAEATLVNVLGIGRHYEEAFTRLSGLLDELPRLTRADTRFQVLAEASQFYVDAGQYVLAAGYADQLLRENPTGQGACKARYLVLHAQYRGQASPAIEPFFESAAVCVAAGEVLFADGIRADIAGLYLRQRRAREAAELLSANYAQVLQDQYQAQISQFNSLLAQAHWQMGELAPTRKFALAAVAASIKGEYTESLVNACRLLYEVERKQGHTASALAYHERYMTADKAYLDDVSAKALAYQTVKQQVQAKKAELAALARQNQILELQQALDRKAMEAGRLYIAVLLLGLLVIGLWLLRLKRSQLQFMRMARCDSLTGIYNRKHFMGEAEHALRYAERSGRGACLVLIDLDYFKLTNDTYGHAVGDLVLRRTVVACQEHLRSTDVFGRLGGEEFGVLLPECALDSGIERAQMFRRAIAALSDQTEPGVPVSASFGLAFTGESGCDLRQLMVDADDALYRAKRAGRNCVVAGKAGAMVIA